MDTVLPAYTFWLEWIARYAFVVAWLVKGRIDKDIQNDIKK
ncbi:hypothetical protein [Aquimarina sp. RZ0]|nr:hypothetical protein [Aquimarina sp. RZ0]